MKALSLTPAEPAKKLRLHPSAFETRFSIFAKI